MTDRSLNERAAREIRAEMARQRIGQHKLATQCGWTQPYLSRRLTGRNAFSTDDLEAIAGVLGVNAAALIDPDGASTAGKTS